MSPKSGALWSWSFRLQQKKFFYPVGKQSIFVDYMMATCSWRDTYKSEEHSDCHLPYDAGSRLSILINIQQLTIYQYIAPKDLNPIF